MKMKSSMFFSHITNYRLELVMRNRFLNFRKKQFLILAIVLVSIIVLPTIYLPQLEREKNQYKFLLSWGSKGTGDGQFSEPNGIAVDSSGNVYVTDGNSRVQKFSSSGTFITELSSKGTGPDQFFRPTSIAVDSSGNVYVLDWGRVMKFTNTGAYVSQWREAGSDAGQLNRPGGIAVDSASNVYVIDNVRVEKFTASGSFIASWPSQLIYPSGVAVDSSGNVYVTDSVIRLVQKFTSDGKYITQLGMTGRGPSQFLGVGGVAVDASGNVYETDPDNGRVLKFSGDGKYITQLGNSTIPWAVAVDASGNVYVTDRENDRVQKFGTVATISVDQIALTVAIALVALTFIILKRPKNLRRITSKRRQSETKTKKQSKHNLTHTFSKQRIKLLLLTVILIVTILGAFMWQAQEQKKTPNFALAWGSQGSGSDQLLRPTGVAVDSSGNTYIINWGYSRIEKFTGFGSFITGWNSDLCPTSLTGVAVDSRENVYVIDSWNNLVQKFTSNGTTVTQWGSSGDDPGQFVHPSSVAVDSSGNVYVTDSGNRRVEKFTGNGAFITQWGAYGLGPGQFVGPTGIAVDSSGNVYVADSNNNRVEKFTTADGISYTYVSQLGCPTGSGSCFDGSGNGQFSSPFGVAVDSSGNLYVTDQQNNRVQKFTGDGKYVTQWGSKGSGPGQFNAPWGAAVDSSGNIYVIDRGNARVQKFVNVTIIPVGSVVLVIVTAVIGSVGAYVTMRKRPKNLRRRLA